MNRCEYEKIRYYDEKRTSSRLLTKGLLSLMVALDTFLPNSIEAADSSFFKVDDSKSSSPKSSKFQMFDFELIWIFLKKEISLKNQKM